MIKIQTSKLTGVSNSNMFGVTTASSLVLTNSHGITVQIPTNTNGLHLKTKFIIAKKKSVASVGISTLADDDGFIINIEGIMCVSYKCTDKMHRKNEPNADTSYGSEMFIETQHNVDEAVGKLIELELKVLSK